MSVFRWIEGLISTRETRKLDYFAFDGSIGIVSDLPFDFGGLRRNISIQTNRTIRIRFNSVTSDQFAIGVGQWRFENQYAERVFVTTTIATNLAILAHG